MTSLASHLPLLQDAEMWQTPAWLMSLGYNTDIGRWMMRSADLIRQAEREPQPRTGGDEGDDRAQTEARPRFFTRLMPVSLSRHP